jgi:DNA-binding transcriptional LysR family regulator
MECFARNLGPRVLKELRRKHPRVTSEALVGGTETVVDRLAANHLDVAIAFDVPARSEIKTIFTTSVPIGITAATRHPICELDAKRLTDCLDYPFVLPDRSLSFRGLIDDAFARVGGKVIATVTANSTEFIKETLRDRAHLSLMSWLDVCHEAIARELVFFPLRDAVIPHQRLSISVPVRMRNSSLAMLVAGMLQNEIQASMQHQPKTRSSVRP